MPSWYSKTDTVQKEIVSALRRAGALVFLTHRVGGGFPDIVVLWRGQWLLAELKTGNAGLNAAEQEWHAKAARSVGKVYVWRTAEQALRELGGTDGQT